MMAKPGENSNSRLGILTSALFHRSTLPPYHHVANVDRMSGRTFDTPLGYSSLGRLVKDEHRDRERKARAKAKGLPAAQAADAAPGPEAEQRQAFEPGQSRSLWLS